MSFPLWDLYTSRLLVLPSSLGLPEREWYPWAHWHQPPAVPCHGTVSIYLDKMHLHNVFLTFYVPSSWPEMDDFEEFWVSKSREDVNQLLSDDQAWEKFVAEWAFMRNNADYLGYPVTVIKADALKMESLEDPDKITDDPDKVTDDPDKITDDPDENMDNFDENMAFEKMEHELDMFLCKYPRLKLELEKYIQNLYSTADNIDEIHKDCTITNVVAGSTGVVSGILTIMGIALAPVTAGGSLALSITGIGLGAAATVTGVSAGIIDHVNDLKGRKLLSEVEGNTNANVAEKVLFKEASKLFSTLNKHSQIFKDFDNHWKAFQVTKTNPHLMEASHRLMTGAQISSKNRRQINKAFRGTTLALTKQGRIQSATLAGASILVDVTNIVKDSMHLSNGAKTTTAMKLREYAQALEKKLEELSNHFEKLQKMKIQYNLLSRWP
uniref:Apolipoprotein L6-like n=2 Tax=Monodelphis domestica TaxID=13616 RepID=F6RAU7_MONDO